MAASELPQGEVHLQSNGVRATIAVAWLPSASRQDTGQAQSFNNECVKVNQIGAGKDCILLEVIP